jgi:ribosomal protein L11 methyltransferase
MTVSLYADTRGEIDAFAAAMKGISYEIVSLADDDWKTKWKQYVRPFRITSDIAVIPAWKDIPSKRYAGLQRVLLDTDMAFGDGLHATTRLVARLLEKYRGTYSSFLDVGCGSGILSLVARVYGAKVIVATDIEPESYETTKANFVRNAIGDATVTCGDFADFSSDRTFDCIAANILSKELLRFPDKFAALLAPYGILIVSGVNEEHFPDLEDAFFGHGLRCVLSRRTKGWRGAVFSRR